MKGEILMSRIKGKIPTRDQRHVLNSVGIKDTTDWLYVETKFVSDDGAKNVARNSSKHKEMVFVNSNTSEYKSIPVKEDM